MKTIIEYIKSDTKTCFKCIKDKDCFYSSGTLYMKIFQQDLTHFNIDNVNAISVLNAGLTFFQSDETVIEAIRSHKTVKVVCS